MITWHDGIHGEERSKRERLADSEHRLTYTRWTLIVARFAYVLCFVSTTVNLWLGDCWLASITVLLGIVGALFGLYSAGRSRRCLPGLRAEVETRRSELAEVQERILRET